MNICLVCKNKEIIKTRYDDLGYCNKCYRKYCCLTCNREFNRCIMCHKFLCNCTNNEIKYEYGAETHYCKSCFEKQDELINLYNYFKNKYNEQLTLIEIQKIIKANQN